jgi:hypothetical protein
MSMPSKGMRKLNPNETLDEMEWIGNNLFKVGVAADSDPEFKAYIMAAGATYAAGNRSVDNILRKHRSRWIEGFEKKAEADKRGAVGLRAAVLREISVRCRKISQLDLTKVMSSGIVAAANALIRMTSAFRAASHLIRLGLEQVAWSNVVRSLTEPEEVAKLSGTGHITQLKSLFPGAGPRYNRLSDLAHIAPSTHERFMVEQDNGLMIQIQAPRDVAESMRLLVVLMDAFLVVGEECFEHVGLPCTNLDPLTRRPKADRPARGLIEEFENVFPPGTKFFFDAWWR